MIFLRRTWLDALLYVCLLVPTWASAQQVYRITDIGTLVGADDTYGVEINESGQVTGTAIVNGKERAYLWNGSALISLGTLGGSGSAGHAINNAGQVTGRSKTTGNLEEHTFLWDGDSMQDLGTLGGDNSEATDINDSGQVTGVSDIAGSATQHAFLWDGEDLQDLGTLGGSSSRGNAINAAGQVAGYANTASGAEHAFRWSGGVMRDLGTLGGTNSRGELINESGQVAGWAQIAGNGADHAFLWSGGAIQDLGTLVLHSYALGINDSGQVVGASDTIPRTTVRAFLWEGNAMQDLGSLGGTRTGADRINSSGQIVGTGWTSSDSESIRAVVWIDGTLHDLNDLIDPSDQLKSYVTLTSAGDINDRGQILVSGTDSRTSGNRVYILSPVAADVFLYLAMLTDVNGNGAADAAVLAGNKVYVKDGATGDSISEMTVLDADWQALDLEVTPGGAGSSIGILVQSSDGLIAVALYRARDGRFLREIPYFTRNWLPLALIFAPNADGPGGSAFGVLAQNVNDQRVALELRRRSDGSLVNSSKVFPGDWQAIQFDTIDDVSGNNRPEIVALGRSGLGLSQVLVKDAETTALVNKVNYFGANSTPNAIALIENIGGGTSPEMSVLGELPDGRHLVQIRDVRTDERFDSVYFFNSSWDTVGIEGLADVNGNASADLAVLAQHDTNRAIKAQVRDASTGELIRTVTFFGPSWSARAFAAFADIDGNGVQEIGVAARQDDGEIRVQLRDASTGAIVRTMAIP